MYKNLEHMYKNLEHMNMSITIKQTYIIQFYSAIPIGIFLTMIGFHVFKQKHATIIIVIICPPTHF